MIGIVFGAGSNPTLQRDSYGLMRAGTTSTVQLTTAGFLRRSLFAPQVEPSDAAFVDSMTRPHVSSCDSSDLIN